MGSETTTQNEQAVPIKIDYLPPSETITQNNEPAVTEASNQVTPSGTTTQNEQDVVEEVNDEEVVVKEAKVIPAERFEKKIDRTVAPHNPVETVGTINQQTV